MLLKRFTISSSMQHLHKQKEENFRITSSVNVNTACSKLCHPNIVRLICIYNPPQQLFPMMIMEFMDKSLNAYAVKPDVSFKERMAILQDVAEGLNYLHSCCYPPVIHRDLSSPNNILLKHEPPLLVAKLADL